MFSSIEEAWNHNPVEEMTHRLSQGEFRKNPIDEMIYVKDRDQWKKKQERSEDSVASISLNGISDTYTNSKKSKRQFSSKNIRHYNNPLTSDVDDSEMSDFQISEKCIHSIRHLKKCGYCYRKLSKIIDKKVKKKCEELQLEKQLRDTHDIPIKQESKTSFFANGQLREVTLIIVGGIIALFIIFLMFRNSNRG